MSAHQSSTRPQPWLLGVADDVSTYLGVGPLVRHPGESSPTRRELGVCYRRCWVWFPGNVNHYLAVDRYPDRTPGYHVWAGNHAGVFVGVWTAQPTPDKVRAVLVLAGFLDGDDTASRELLGRQTRWELEFVDATPEVSDAQV